MDNNEKENVFATLYATDVNNHVKKKKTGGKNPDGSDKTASFLSWVWAWGKVKQLYPDASYEVRHWDDKPYLNDDQFGIMVETSVTINGETITMWLPVMSSDNKALKSTPYTIKTSFGEKEIKAATMTDINKTIMRCLAKNIAMFGLGLYIYAGEDLPEDNTQSSQETASKQAAVRLANIEASLYAAKSLQELQRAWQAIPAGERVRFVEIKDEMKNRLADVPTQSE